jgi:competence protein ComGC
MNRTAMEGKAMAQRDRASRSGRRSAGGFTLVETMVVTTVIGVLTLLITESLADLSRSQTHTRGQWRIAEVNDSLMRGLAKDVACSVRLFTDGVVADDYLAALDYPATSLAPDSRLPALTDVGVFVPDGTGELLTGNVLFLGRFQAPESVEVPAAGGGTEPRRIDVLSFILYFTQRGADGHLDLERWGSAPLASYEDLMVIGAGERATAAAELHQKGVRHAWAIGSDAGDGLFAITSSGNLMALGSRRVPGDPAERRTGVLRGRGMRVAENGTVGKLEVPAYAEPGPLGFPGGFELRVDGPTTGKLLLIRLALRKGDSGGNFSEVVRVLSCRDG